MIASYYDWPDAMARGWLKLYTAGPMTGHHLFNWPMFERRAKLHRRQGHWIVCPTEIDEESGMVIVKRAPDGSVLRVEQSDTFDYESVLQLDLQAIWPGTYEGVDNPWGPSVVPCDGIVLLPGWRTSSGAKRELAHAEEHGLLVFEGDVPDAVIRYDGWPRPGHRTTSAQRQYQAAHTEPVPDVAGRDLGPFGAGFSRFSVERPVTVHDTIQTVRIELPKGETLSENTPQQASESIDQFDTGATRNSSGHKHDYEGFLSFRVIRRYGEYMHKNRHLADGSIRGSDNWQNGIPFKRYMQSLWRHLVDVWEIWRRSNETPEIEVVIIDFDGKEVDAEEALCGVIFNASGALDSILRGKEASFDPARKYGRKV